MGSHSLGEKIFSTYGNSYGSRLRVVMVTKDSQAKNKKEIKVVTKTVHNMYMRQKMNPLSDLLDESERKIFDDGCYAFLEKMTCEYLDATKKDYLEGENAKGDVLPNNEVVSKFKAILGRRRDP